MKIFLNENSFKGQIVIDKNKTGFQNVVLLPRNLYLKDNFTIFLKSDKVLAFLDQLVICSRKLYPETINCFLYC